MMRSVSIDEDRERFAALLGSDESQSASLRDLFVKVDKPEKHVEGYVTYNVKTTVSVFNRNGFDFDEIISDSPGIGSK